MHTYKLDVPRIPSVSNDIEWNPRGNPTTMGCYHGAAVIYTVNASMGGLLGWREGHVLGQQDSIKVVLINTGSTPLTTASIDWTYNGTTRTTPWTGNLAPGSETTIYLGNITYMAGYFTIEACLTGLGSLTDQNPRDNTVRVSGYVCPSVAGGTYTIGATGDYSSIGEALSIFDICGINGDITLEFQPGLYDLGGGGIALNNLAGPLGSYKLTITSTTDNADDVIIEAFSIGFLLSNSDNITIKAITVNAVSAQYAVRFLGH